MKKREYHAIGLMSGTSLDGLDIASCVFKKKNNQWEFQIDAAETIPYDDQLSTHLHHAHTYSGLELKKLDVELGSLFAASVNAFIEKHSCKPDFIASHGHTIFHQPDIQLTHQIGSGAVLAAHTGLMTICDFRSTDVALGGQGAPLVPIADKDLFPDYDICMNLGGFANATFKDENMVAFDICPCNMIFNLLAKELQQPFDKDGEIARSGLLIAELLSSLNAIPFYQKPKEKSLGKEWFEEKFLPIIDQYSSYSTADVMRTCAHHIAYQISLQISQYQGKNVLITGGGAKNTFLIELLSKSDARVHIPDKKIIDFKEALAFAYLGVKRLEEEHNCMRETTGANRNSCGGAIYFGRNS